MNYINPYLVAALILLLLGAVIGFLLPALAAVVVVLNLAGYVAGFIGLVILVIQLVKSLF